MICVFLISFAGVNIMNLEFAKTHIDSGRATTQYNLETYIKRINISYISLLSNEDFFSLLDGMFCGNGGMGELNNLLDGIVTDYIRDIDIISSDGKYYRICSDNKVQSLDKRQI